MNTEELTQIATAHQQAITRHEMEMADIRAILSQGFQQQQAAMAQQQAAMAQHEQEMAEIRAQQRLNPQDISELKGSIQELRNLVADYIQARLQSNSPESA